MKFCLHTPLPRFANALWDVLKLFYESDGFAVVATAPLSAEDVTKAQFTATVPTDDMQTVDHTVWEQDGSTLCRFVLQGKSAQRQADIPAKESDLVRRRMLKRLCKMTLYDLCKQVTGKHPTWGALTGIRPTRLFYEQLAMGKDHAQAQAALQTEFDVLPEKAALLSRIVAEQQALPQAGAKDWDVYIAIPFCPTRCTYCTFAGETIGARERVAAYFAALEREMDAAVALMAQNGARLRALYIGGGTPVSPDDAMFAWLLERITERFPNPLEFTVEAGRPDAMTANKLEAMRRAGVERICVNPQTMNETTLRRIGRGHSAEQVVTAFRMARAYGFAHINMDVIAGLPGETPQDFRYTMERLAELDPDSLTVHTLALKRGGRLNPAQTPLPPVAAVEAMVAIGAEAAGRMGMRPYYLYRQKYMAAQQQNVGYAKENKACLYNMDIMEETATILALGAGAISKRVLRVQDVRIKRAPNAGNVDVYSNNIGEMIRRKQRLFLEE